MQPKTFALQDRDTVVFLGDSITAARTYGKTIENYTLLRFPQRRVRFINSGWGGDTMAGGLTRLERDVFAHKATVVVVAYGVNDIGWGTKADTEHKKLYLDSLRELITQCQKRRVRVFLCSAAATAEDPTTAESGFLQKMCDEGMALARALGEQAIDVQRAMRTIQRKGKPALHVADGIHLTDLGQLAMAFAILKGLGAPANVSHAAVDAQSQRVLTATGCRVTGLHGGPDAVRFDRLDDGLPVNFGVFGALQFQYIPIPDELDRYLLTVKNLRAGSYDVLADSRALGTFSAQQLAETVNICSSTADGWEPGGPWDAQAGALIRVTDARHELLESQRQLDHFLPSHPDQKRLHAETKAALERLEALQRTLVRPRPFRFEVRLRSQ